MKMGDLRDSDAEALERAQYLLERMLDLAERSADENCPDERRPVLQKGFAFLQAEVLEILDKRDEGDI